MNEMMQAILDRRSCKKYKPTMVPKEDIEEIIEAGLFAANGRGNKVQLLLR